MEWGGKPLGDIRVRAQETADAVELSVAHTLPEGGEVSLYWGIAPEGHSPAWSAPDPAHWPFTPSGARAPTVPAGPHAVESAFPAAECVVELRQCEHELRLRFPKPEVTTLTAAAAAAPPAAVAPPSSLPDEVRFVVLRRDPTQGNMWLKQKCAARSIAKHAPFLHCLLIIAGNITCSPLTCSPVVLLPSLLNTTALFA